MKTVICDYGLGNIFSVRSALRAVGLEPAVDIDGSMIESADFVVLPGVAAFGDGMRKLKDAGQFTGLATHINRGKPFLGICLGAHMLFDESEESLDQRGLGIVDGRARRLANTSLRLPNQGWLRVDLMDHPGKNTGGFLGRSEALYFSHSYVMDPTDPQCILAEARTDQGGFPACIMVENVLGVQFHPERSGSAGLAFLEQAAVWATTVGS